jgi:DUF1009 family protein
MAAAGAKLLAIEADKTIIIDQPGVIEYAEEHKLIIVALDSAAARAID